MHVEAPSTLSPIERRNFVADTTQFVQATGWRPQISLVDGIDRTIAAFLAEGTQFR
jgi:nucleoside-diphosphate-sugar epimerase